MSRTDTLVKPLCPLFGSCGGCQYQNIPYREELACKEAILKDLLIKEIDISDKVLEPIVPSPIQYHYRNRLDLTLRKRNNGERQMGFMLPGTQKLQEVTSCPIARREIDDFLPQLKEEAVRKLPADYRVANLVVRVGEGGKVFWGGIGRRSLRMREEDYFWVTIQGRKIFFALDTFFQTNLAILENVISRIGSFIDWKKETVFLDLYSGVGLFGILLADRVGKVIMIESGCDSVRLAHYNLAYHNLKNVEIREGQVEMHLPDVLEAFKDQPCVGLIDPPRSGLATSVIEAMIKAKGLSILFYLSCSPESLVRDLKKLTQKVWHIQKIIPFDFFPKTQHLETLVWLVRSR